MKSVDEILSQYNLKTDLIDVLNRIQDEYGYISEEHMNRIEQTLKIPAVDIYGVITFYSAFKLKPSGTHILRVCTGTACHVKKSLRLIEHIKEKLGVEEGETTKDGKITLELVNCIGACAKAPALMIDDTVHGNMSVEKVDEVLKDYQ